MVKINRNRIKNLLVSLIPGFIVAVLILGANIHYDLDLGKVIVDQVTRIYQDLEVLTGQIIGKNAEKLLLGVTNDIFQVERGGNTYIVCDSSGNCAGSFGYAFASGSAGYLAKFTATSTLQNSIVLDNGSLVSILGQFQTQGTTTLATSTGFVGIGTTAPSSLLTVGAIGGFQVDSEGNLIKVRGVNYSWPSSQGGSNTYLKNDGSGNLTWAEITAGVGGTGDANSVAFWISSDTLSYDSNFVWTTSTQRLGIGISSPSEKLTVAGNIGIQAGTDAFLGTLDNYGLSLKTNNTDRIFITNDGKVGIGTSTPEYKLDVAGNLRATLSITAGINVETLTADKTLTPGIDKMYQYLDPGGANRIITLDTTNAKAGDKFIIRNNGAYNSSYYLQIQQGTTVLDYIYAQSIREYIFDGTNWVSGDVGTGISSDYNVTLGFNAKGYSYGTAVGSGAAGFNYGAAVGTGAQGMTAGAAVGFSAKGNLYGVAVGVNTQGFNYGAAVGAGAKGMRYGVAVGYYAGYNIDTTADRYNVLVGAFSGYQLTTGIGNIILGYQSGYDATYSPTTGSKNILIGFQAGTPATTTSNFLNIGNLIFATGVNTATGAAISIGNVGIATTTPNALLTVFGSTQGTTPLLRIATSTTEALFIDTSGNIGIGTTTPSSKLTINGDLYVSATSTLADVLPISDNTFTLGLLL